MIHTVEGFSVVNEAVDVFLEPSCFFDDPADVGNVISGSFAFSKTSLNICDLRQISSNLSKHQFSHLLNGNNKTSFAQWMPGFPEIANVRCLE